jgi:predicted transcriptional regulator
MKTVAQDSANGTVEDRPFAAKAKTGPLAALASHYTRVRAYVVLAERTASPKELAPILNRSISHVGYHCRRLEKLGIIELVDTKQRRGATEHFYRAIARPYIEMEEWEKLSADQRRELSRLILQLVFADVISADESESFDSRLNRSLFRFPIVLDEEGFARMYEIHRRLYEETVAVWTESLERMAESGEQGIRTMATWMLFEQAPHPLNGSNA